MMLLMIQCYCKTSSSHKTREEMSERKNVPVLFKAQNVYLFYLLA